MFFALEFVPFFRLFLQRSEWYVASHFNLWNWMSNFKSLSFHVPTLDSNLLIVRNHASVVLLKAYSLRPYRFLKVGVWWHNLNALSRHINTPFTNLPPAEWVLWWTTPLGAKSDCSHCSDLTVNLRVCVPKLILCFSDFLCVQPCTKKKRPNQPNPQTHKMNSHAGI